MCLICESGAHGVDQLHHNTTVDEGRASVRHVELSRQLVHHKLLVLGRVHRFETPVAAELPVCFGKSACTSGTMPKNSAHQTRGRPASESHLKKIAMCVPHAEAPKRLYLCR